MKEIARDAPEAAGGLRDIGDASGSASGGIVSLGDAASAASGGLSNFKALLLGTVGGFALATAGTVIAKGFDLAATAVGSYVRSLFDNSEKIATDLKAHDELIRRIKGAWAEASGGASSYGLNSRNVLRFETQQNARRLEENLKRELRENMPTGGIKAGIFDDTSAYQDDLREVQRLNKQMRDDIRAGTADVIAYRDALADIGDSLPQNSPVIGYVDDLLESTAKAAEIQAEFARTQDLLKETSEASARALGGEAEFFNLDGTPA